MQSTQSSRITTPIENPQSSTPSGPGSHEEQDWELKSFPEPDNVEQYREIRKEPYSFEYFGLGDDVKNISSYRNYADFIDEFVLSEIANNDFENTIDSYRDILLKITENMGLDENVKGITKMEKLYKWMKNVMLPQRKLEERKRKILNG